MNDEQAVWANGPIARVVAQPVTYRGRAAWAVRLENEHGIALKCDDGSVEVSHPYPGNRKKTEGEAKRLAKHHGVRAYTYDRGGRGMILLYAPEAKA